MSLGNKTGGRDATASNDAGGIGPQLGLLTSLPGTWVGTGFNVIALPDFQGGKKFRLMLNALKETTEFKDIGAPIPNRGNDQGDIEYKGVHYLQEINDANSGAGLHLETGMWLNLPAQAGGGPTVARMSVIPHGDALLAQGNFFAISGAPVIESESSIPFTLDSSGKRIDDPNKDTYLKPYFEPEALLPRIPAASPLPAISLKPEAVQNPNLILVQTNEQLQAAGNKFLTTLVLRVSATPVGAIQGTPFTTQPADKGGITNIPFVVRNANANSMASIFWICEMQKPDGSKFWLLQYSQTVILDFAVPGPDGAPVDIKWPHISVATLIKQ